MDKVHLFEKTKQNQQNKTKTTRPQRPHQLYGVLGSPNKNTHEHLDTKSYIQGSKDSPSLEQKREVQTNP